MVLDVVEHQLLGLPVQDDLRARRQERETLLDLMGESPPGRSGERSIPDVEPEFLALVPDKVQCGQDGLVGGEAQTAAELLQEDRRALGGPQEQDGVDCGQVETLIEEVGSEQDVDLSIAQRAERLGAVGPGGWCRSPKAPGCRRR